MSEMPAFDNPFFESHLEMTEFDPYDAMGVDLDLTADKVNNVDRPASGTETSQWY